jgi:hypothetical protein
MIAVLIGRSPLRPDYILLRPSLVSAPFLCYL